MPPVSSPPYPKHLEWMRRLNVWLLLLSWLLLLRDASWHYGFYGVLLGVVMLILEHWLFVSWLKKGLEADLSHQL